MSPEMDSGAMPPETKYWFPAKRYGWGWGFPVRWQGWLVVGAFVALVVLGALLFPPSTQMSTYVSYVVLLTLVLAGICWLTGEPPRWRWGGDRR